MGLQTSIDVINGAEGRWRGLGLGPAGLAMAQDSVKQGGGLTRGKQAVKQVWPHQHGMPGMNRRSDAKPRCSQHQGPASLHLLQQPKLRCKCYQTCLRASYPSPKAQSFVELQTILDLVALSLHQTSPRTLRPYLESLPHTQDPASSLG